MPGRGQPWKGVGKGNPDRIGSGAIKDGSITEADLDSSVTSKLNSTGHVIQEEGTPLTQQSNLNFTGAGVVASVGGEDTTVVTIAGGGYDIIEDEGTPLTQRTELNFVGAGVVASDDGEKTIVTIAGGGGGLDTLDTALLREDFYWSNPTAGAFEQKYSFKNASINIGGANIEKYGVLALTVGQSTAGNGCAFTTEDGWKYNTSTTDIVWKGVLAVDDLTNSMVACGVMNTTPTTFGGNITTQADFFTAITTGFGFIFDPATSANWQIWTTDAGTETVTTTTTAVATALTKLKVTWTKGSQAVFNINGVDVGTISTNIPTDEVFNVFLVFNKIATTEILDIDLLEVQCERL
jgi:hypothetical protein